MLWGVVEIKLANWKQYEYLRAVDLNCKFENLS
jgi:hypothetical protein